MGTLPATESEGAVGVILNPRRTFAKRSQVAMLMVAVLAVGAPFIAAPARPAQAAASNQFVYVDVQGAVADVTTSPLLLSPDFSTSI
ncbi:MAG: hypothetical protein WKF86_07970, partial [Acidimicrobiales bacterium]